MPWWNSGRAWKRIFCWRCWPRKRRQHPRRRVRAKLRIDGRTEFERIEETLKKNKKLKLKTHRGAAKRFKVTSTGKVMRAHSGKRHLLGTKRPKRMRHLRKSTMVNEADLKV